MREEVKLFMEKGKLNSNGQQEVKLYVEDSEGRKCKLRYEDCNEYGAWFPDKFYLEQEEVINNNHPLALLNTSIVTTTGEYKLEDIDLEEVRYLVWRYSNNLDSAIGHQATAQIMTELLNVEIATNRQMFEQKVGQKALVFKLNDRPEEGKILTKAEIEKIGYKFQLLTRLA